MVHGEVNRRWRYWIILLLKYM